MARLGTLAAMEDSLRRLLDELDAAIDRTRDDDGMTEADQAELARLVELVNARLHGEEHDHDGLVDSLEGSAVRFENDHPTLTSAIRRAVDLLSAHGM